MKLKLFTIKEKLKKCPFCYQSVIIHQRIIGSQKDFLENYINIYFWLSCESCHVAIPEYDNLSSAISHWNRRTENN